MWVKNTWYVAAFPEEVQRERLLSRTFLDEPVVLYRREDGGITALHDRCLHRQVPLSIGFLDGDKLVCGYHGMTFDPSGRCVAIPAQEKVPANARVRRYPVEERHGLVWIWMGDADRADPASIPDLGRMAHPEWVPAKGYTHLQADYRLLNDNLLDLSHVTFVHGRTIGNAAVAQSPITVSQQGDDLLVHRDVVGATAPPFYAHLGGYQGRIHRWHTVRYMAPSICVIEVGCNALEAGDGLGRIEGCVMHLVTPETAETTHYLWAFVRHFRQDDAALTDYIRSNVAATHHEDKVVIELQHRGLTASQRDNPVTLAIGVDAGPIRGRRQLEALIAAEQAAREGLPIS